MLTSVLLTPFLLYLALSLSVLSVQWQVPFYRIKSVRVEDNGTTLIVNAGGELVGVGFFFSIYFCCCCCSCIIAIALLEL